MDQVKVLKDKNDSLTTQVQNLKNQITNLKSDIDTLTSEKEELASDFHLQITIFKNTYN